MQSRDFCFWLQRYFEIRDASAARIDGNDPLTMEQVAIIRQHLALVFIHDIDPKMGSKEHQNKLNEVHARPQDQFNYPPGARC